MRKLEKFKKGFINSHSGAFEEPGMTLRLYTVQYTCRLYYDGWNGIVHQINHLLKWMWDNQCINFSKYIFWFNHNFYF